MFKPLFPLIRFVEAPAEPGTSAPVEPPAPTTPAPAAPPAPATPADTAVNPAEKVEDLPDWAQKRIKELGQESGNYRVKAKEAAETAQKDLSEKIAVALGLKPDAAQDPAALTASLTKAQQDALNLARELAVFKAASAAGADASKLLDRTSFMSSIAGLDPTDGAALKAAIESATNADSTLKATRAVGASTVDNPGGSGERGQITEAQLAQMHAAGDHAGIVKAQEMGLLRDLLGG